MFKSSRWRSEKNKIKVVFKLQFHATQVPQLAKDALMVSLIPVEVGKPTVRLEKSAIHDGTCRWENPIYETVKFIQELKTGKINEKVYQFIVSTGSSKGGFVGEVTINFADYIDSIKPSTVSLPLKASTSGAILHVLKILKGVNSFIPHVVLASTVLALIFPPSFTWFTTRYYAPALGFLMFAVGVNSSEKDFIEAFNRPGVILAGYVGQFLVKPLLGFIFGTIAVTVFNLPNSLGAGIMLTSCVSGAQLSNYATFLTDPYMAPLSIVMTSLSTASAVIVTPTLSLFLIGKRLPVDVRGMVSSIMQIVITPIATGLLLNRFFPWICDAIRPLLPALSVVVTALCVGSPLAINIEAVMSPFGLTILLLIIGFHMTSFISGYFLTGLAFRNASDVKPLQRTLSYETGMQSSLLALALANRFFQDPLVGVPPAISVVIMSLMGFSLVMLWAKKKDIAV